MCILIKQFQVEACNLPICRWAMKSVFNCVLRGIKGVFKSPKLNWLKPADRHQFYFQNINLLAYVGDVPFIRATSFDHISPKLLFRCVPL